MKVKCGSKVGILKVRKNMRFEDFLNARIPVRFVSQQASYSLTKMHLCSIQIKFRLTYKSKQRIELKFSQEKHLKSIQMKGLVLEADH